VTEAIRVNDPIREGRVNDEGRWIELDPAALNESPS
jgi:hypothetical protein